MSRLQECIDLMARDDVDVMLLGREANARTVSDAARLWLAGTRPFSPGCVLVRRTREVHILANTDAVVPPGFASDRLYGVTWNPENLIGALTAIDGVVNARRVAVDGMSPMAKALLGRATPRAKIVDANAYFAELWAIADPEKLTGVSAAAAVAGFGFGAMVAALRPGRTARELRGVAAAAFSSQGTTTPAFEAVAAPIAASSSTWLPPERPFVDGERVAMRAGALRDGWEASLARTYVVGAPSVEVDSPDGWDDLVAACVRGETAGALRARGAVVHGVGRGVEAWPDDLVLVPGLTVAIELRDDDTLRQDVVRITDAAPVALTTA